MEKVEPQGFEDFVTEAIEWFRKRGKLANRWYNSSRIALIVLSASLPALISAVADKDSIIPGPLPTIVAVIVAILAGLDAQFKPGDQWRHHRSTQLALTRLQRAYSEPRAEGRNLSFSKYFEEVEALLEAEANRYWQFRITELQSKAAATGR